MWHLFAAELRRFRIWAAIAGVGHLLMLGFMSKTNDLAQQAPIGYIVIGACYALGGLLLGLYQITGYTKPAAWAQLIHRPLPSWRIGGAIFAAGAVWLAVTTALPILLIALWQTEATARVVDTRHWLMALPALLVALIGYLTGGYLALANRRYGFGALVFLLLILQAHAQAWWSLLLQVLVLGCMATLVWITFRPDRVSAPARPLPLIAAFIPTSVCIYVVLVAALRIGLQMTWIALGSAQATASAPEHGTAQESQRATDKALLVMGLRASKDSSAGRWLTQVQSGKVDRYGPMLDALPERQQFTNLAPLSFADETNDARWTFSHDRMQFVGHGLADGLSDRGRLTPPGAAMFPTPTMAFLDPSETNDRVTLLGHNMAWRYDQHSRAVESWQTLSAGEVFAAPPMMIGTHVLALSDQALHIDADANAQHDGRVGVRVPLQGPINVLSRVNIADVDDGYVVSMAYYRALRYESFQRAQYVLHVDRQGRWQMIATRTITQDFPVWFRYIDMWISPVIEHVTQWATTLFAGHERLNPADPNLPPPEVLWLATIMTLLSAALSAAYASRLGSRGMGILAWAVTGLILGLPALLAFWLVAGNAPQYRHRMLPMPVRLAPLN
ncbi:hypothetical protein [Dyella tabacisoli]|uniref:Uncharacterized protein n=1 Tax=Dyella tabacisoli TaxID=2282381 RepID=A0A369UTB7_9GAMM|nr:hypothetical protein [Dyella tabacisoli]RDD83563.1 hypothetical protein DVJ77_03020 [Dyella tabacisoli]